MTKSSKIRPLFKEGFDRISELLSSNEYGNKLCQAFCGCGKSRFAYKAILTSIKLENSINLIVFPSIALITQFNSDYINTGISSGKFKTMSICSKNELENSEYKEFSYTTKKSEIQDFINTNSHKIICCTYQSLSTLTKSLGNTKIKFAIFDEAHRSESTTIKPLIYNDKPFFQLGLFLTATPSDTMKSNMERICYIPYFKALQANYLKPFELRLDIDRKTKTIQEFTIYKSIARAILTTGNNRVMTFHAFSNHNKKTPDYYSDNSESSMSSNENSRCLSLYKTRTSVNTFANKKEFKKALKIIISSEFPHLKDKYSKITVKGIDALTKNRRKILDKFDKTKDDEIFILASCRTIGEGIDTKKANMCVFADPKSSLKDIIQNIGRILRKCKNKITGTVLIPTLIDFKEYSDCKTLDEKDEVLRTNINISDDFNGILNVVSALKQDNEEYFDQCLIYPNENSKNKQKYGKKLEDIIQINSSRQNMSDEDKLQEYTNNNKNIVLFTQQDDMKKYEIIFGDQSEQNQHIINISKTSHNNGGYIYTLGNTKKEEESCKKGCRCNECLEKRKQIIKDHININIHINPEFKVMWKIKDYDINMLLKSAVIDCVIDRDKNICDKWKENLVKVKKYIDENNKRPVSCDKNEDIRSLGYWIGTQQKNYNKIRFIMGNTDVYDMWTEFINDQNYKEYFQSNEDIWKDNLVKVKKYIDDNNKTPSAHGNNKYIRSLGTWICNQKINYSKKRSIMLNTEIYDMWTDFINDRIYKDYIMSSLDSWKNKLCKVKKYIDENKKRPVSCDKNEDVRSLCTWIGNQQVNYSNKKDIMGNTDVYDMWTEFINHPNYKEYFQSNEDIWKDNLVKVKKYIDDNNKRPSATDSNKDIKFLGSWIRTQTTSYNKKVNTEIYYIWKEFINDTNYKEYFKSNEYIWEDKLCKVKKYIDENKKRPVSCDKNKDIKSLGSWICNQQVNYRNKKDIMGNIDVYDMWTEFINDQNYKEYFQSNEDIWKDNLVKVKKYIDDNNKRPSAHDKNKDIKSLGSWICNQQVNYRNKKEIMGNIDVYDMWTEFINDQNYKEYFQSQSHEDIWKDNLVKVKKYIDDNNKRPSATDTNKDIKFIGSWVHTQQKNYNKKVNIMGISTEIYNMWADFINGPKYKQYFFKSSSEETKYTCECGSKIKNTTKAITNHKNTKKHKEYVDKKVDMCEQGCDYVNCEREEENIENCVHVWKVMSDDEKYNYKECELCGRKSKEGRLGKESGYKEPNPQKKKEINEWLTKQEYNNGKAFVLDAHELKTSNALLDSCKFSTKDIVIPEYDINAYNRNKSDKRLGKSVRNGDYLDEMKKCNIEDISLIYADFTGSYKKFVEPLLEYMKEKNEAISVGTVIGFTWSNNGVGTTNVRSKILRKLGKYEIEIGMEEIEVSPTEIGYGDGGCMNVIFYRKTTDSR
jgi:superfamily II DNA or RNA helicase